MVVVGSHRAPPKLGVNFIDRDCDFLAVKSGAEGAGKDFRWVDDVPNSFHQIPMNRK